MSLANRKKSSAKRKKKLATQAESHQSKSGKSFDDPRMWSCARNKDGIGSAVIRFLEPTDADIEYFTTTLGYDEDAVPFYTKQHQHGFKGPNGKWFINNCPTSIVERECPVCEANGEIVDNFGGWNAVDDNHAGKKLVRTRKRKEVYHANVLIVSDPANPENEGEVKIFRYGKAIHDKIMAQLIPEFDDEEQCDVSDFWSGRNFNLKIVNKSGYANYDKSTWGDIEPLADDDSEIEEVLKKQHKLTDFITEDKYKSYDDLVKDFEKTQGGEKRKRRTVEDDDGGDGAPDESTETPDEKPKRRARKKAEPEAKVEAKAEAGGDDDDSDAYFASLLDD